MLRANGRKAREPKPLRRKILYENITFQREDRYPASSRKVQVRLYGSSHKVTARAIDSSVIAGKSTDSWTLNLDYTRRVAPTGGEGGDGLFKI